MLHFFKFIKFVSSDGLKALAIHMRDDLGRKYAFNVVIYEDDTACTA